MTELETFKSANSGFISNVEGLLIQRLPGSCESLWEYITLVESYYLTLLSIHARAERLLIKAEVEAVNQIKGEKMTVMERESIIKALVMDAQEQRDELKSMTMSIEKKLEIGLTRVQWLQSIEEKK